MPRLLFEKTENAVWISHLDLMRVFQRAFKRAGLPLKHTQGFNPRPSVSIALPLSVGVDSVCELLDFELDNDTTPNDQIKERLNQTLIQGVCVLDVYDCGRKLRELSLLKCNVILEYDFVVSEEDIVQINDLFMRDSLVIAKKSKKGIQDQDIIPMIRNIMIERQNDTTLKLEALICCQNPSLNPMQLIAAISAYLPELEPVFSRCSRVELYDTNENVFR